MYINYIKYYIVCNEQMNIILLVYVILFVIGLKPGGKYEVQVLGASQNGLPNIDFSWHFVELPAIHHHFPIPILSVSIDSQSIKVCIAIYKIICF